jgi:diguanylate cyclase (GGDEF)-like protein
MAFFCASIAAPAVVLLAALLALACVVVAFLGRELRRARRGSARHFERSRELICVAGPDGRVESAGPAFEHSLGVREEELVGRRLADLVAQSEWLDREGEPHFLEWSMEELPEPDPGTYAVARDVTERRELELELERLSQHDQLTGVFNRRRFDAELSARLTQARYQERGGALLLIDLDRFRRINDELGHAAGDLALREVARVLEENTRGADVVGRDADGIVARVGGNEFAVLLNDIGPVEAAVVGKRLVRALDAVELSFEGAQVPLAVSVGVAPFDGRDKLDADSLLGLADRAMYVVKADGGGGAGEAAPAGAQAGPKPA